MDVHTGIGIVEKEKKFAGYVNLHMKVSAQVLSILVMSVQLYGGNVNMHFIYSVYLHGWKNNKASFWHRRNNKKI
eukprot:CAMPEP_0178962052 /NCGR_PEP_ID=MMETSP0789-20121207/14110_1 /TAXON_ID=3005 /ORGANISM="Rhizosolenia setigera, Strain CCMP 1694" /LENGTH=74 /DNA_ID=CAMNT_0020646079 /DNA_START=74 /DNA_END=298 /DNA_ORIENTATION=+